MVRSFIYPKLNLFLNDNPFDKQLPLLDFHEYMETWKKKDRKSDILLKAEDARKKKDNPLAIDLYYNVLKIEPMLSPHTMH